ncbi:MAG: septum formation initiator family protein [Alphaproteobacteria bacterium]|nr:septum formation initiator family protein [Alphaproteobacteria bacterium]
MTRWNRRDSIAAMLLFNELRARAKQVIAPALGIAAITYFGYHTIQGDHGILAWVQLAGQVNQAQATVLSLEAERVRLANRVRLLHPDHLDLDMLDEQARRLLNVGRRDEILVLVAPSVEKDGGGTAHSPYNN